MYPKNEEILEDFGQDFNDFVERWNEEAGGGPGEAPRAARAGGEPGAALPCLYTSNVTEQSVKAQELSAKYKAVLAKNRAKNYREKYLGKRLVQAYDRKSAQCLFLNASGLLGRGVERIAFVTLTTGENHSYWTKEGWGAARDKFRSWIGHKTGLASVFGPSRDWVRVIEPQRRGAIHWHMLIDCGVDIRTGVDFEAFARGDYRTACPSLRSMWANLRKSCKAYGFGRSSVEPIKSDKWEAAARYVGKYISKGIGREVQEFECEGVLRPDHSRRIGYSSGWKVANTDFAWVDSGDTWRRGVGIFAEMVDCQDMRQLRLKVGKSWAYRNRGLIGALASGEPLDAEQIATLHCLMGGEMARFENADRPDPF